MAIKIHQIYGNCALAKLLVKSKRCERSLWGSSPGNYTLYESAGSYNYPIQEIGTLSVVATPEPSTWAMLVLGFGGLCLVGRRRQRSARLAPSLG
jgi:hypothetical protein